MREVEKGRLQAGCMKHCHYCCKSFGGHAVIIWKPAGLSCAFAVGQCGLSVTTNQFRVDECVKI